MALTSGWTAAGIQQLYSRKSTVNSAADVARLSSRVIPANAAAPAATPAPTDSTVTPSTNVDDINAAYAQLPAWQQSYGTLFIPSETTAPKPIALNPIVEAVMGKDFAANLTNYLTQAQQSSTAQAEQLKQAQRDYLTQQHDQAVKAWGETWYGFGIPSGYQSSIPTQDELTPGATYKFSTRLGDHGKLISKTGGTGWIAANPYTYSSANPQVNLSGQAQSLSALLGLTPTGVPRTN